MDNINKITSKSDERQFIVVQLGNEQYGIDIKHVQNIVRMLNITRVPKAPYYIKGVVNLRGEIIPVMSVRLKFELQADEVTNTTRIIFVKVDGHAIGLMVDQVKEVIQIGDNHIELLHSDSSDEKSNHVWGVGKVGEELVTLLNVESLINHVDTSKM